MKRKPNIMLSSDVKIGLIFQSNNYGKVEIINITSTEKGQYVDLLFLETGYRSTVQKKDVVTGYVRDPFHPSRFGVGYEGKGIYKLSKDNEVYKCTVIWKSMLERCYCPKFQKKNPTYIGVTVCKEWHNYQTFAEWFYKNYPSDGKVYQLDKDSVVAGSKLYSPDTCCFLTQQENKAFSKAKHYRFISPNGELVEFKNLTEYCKGKDLTRENMSKVYRGERYSHKGWIKAP